MKGTFRNAFTFTLCFMIDAECLINEVLFLCQSHAGLFNLCIVVLVAVNSRLIIENIMKVYLFILTL